MRVIPVPESVRNAEWVEGTAVFSAPDGDLTSEKIAPAEGLFFTSRVDGFGDQECPFTGVVLVLEDDDMAMIERGTRHLVMYWPGRAMPVFMTPFLLEGVE